jgi:hypothetical protein
MNEQDEAHYHFVVSDFSELSLIYGLDKMLEEVLQYRKHKIYDSYIQPLDDNPGGF